MFSTCFPVFTEPVAAAASLMRLGHQGLAGQHVQAEAECQAWWGCEAAFAVAEE